MSEFKQEIDWEDRWKTGNTQWDHGEPSPALVELFNNEETKGLIPTSGSALVPGCGAGYDVVFLANKDRHAIGMDLSETCMDLLHKNHPNAAENNYEFILANFFDFQVPENGFNLAYDYTFLCALEPHLRNAWANRYKEIIVQDGVLITLMFPLDDREDGPPFSLSVEIYHELLDEHFDLLYIKDAVGHESRIGKEKIAIWKRK